MPRQQRLTLTPEQVQVAPAGRVPLTPAQSHYLLRVLRLQAGDRFLGIADQTGWWWELAVSPDPHTALVVGTVPNDRELSWDLVLGIALPKGNHLEQVIPAVTELGVTQIIPLYSDRSAMQPSSPPSSHKRQRWQKLAQEASELSLRSCVPLIQPPMLFSQFCQECNSPHRFLCVTTPAPHLFDLCTQTDFKGTITVLTGCEGGWTATEQKLAITQGFLPVSLGKRVLSAITAPVVALSIITSAIEGCP
ncbi:MAG: RsmE family RNA methyltransferase [Pseudanabaenaceae cyanobacterium]